MAKLKVNQEQELSEMVRLFIMGKFYRYTGKRSGKGTGLECGISIRDFIDFKEKDVIESYIAEEIRRTI